MLVFRLRINLHCKKSTFRFFPNRLKTLCSFARTGESWACWICFTSRYVDTSAATHLDVHVELDCRVQVQAMFSVHQPTALTKMATHGHWPHVYVVSSISLASRDSKLLWCVGAVSDYLINVFWLWKDEASSLHSFLRGIRFP